MRVVVVAAAAAAVVVVVVVVVVLVDIIQGERESAMETSLDRRI